jgi:hypothetical protein
VKCSDLKRVRWNAQLLASRDMPGTAEMLNDMATEIEALRVTLAEALAAIEHGPGPEAAEWVARTRCLLPTLK